MNAKTTQATRYETARQRLQQLISWWDSQPKGARNEATTRLHLVDELLLGALDWPKSEVIAEERYDGKYADYSLGRPATRLIVEAKREGSTFELPLGVGPGSVDLPTVLESSVAVADAVGQVLQYCQER